MNRRKFLKGTAGFGALGFTGMNSLLSGCASNPMTIGDVGIQLYTIRNMMNVNMEASLAQVAEVGYKEVEFFNYYGRSAKNVKAMIDQNGLVSPSIHVDIDQLRGDALKETIEYAKTMEQKYITLAWLGEENRKSMDMYRQHAELFQTVGEECNKVGIKFAYHNHEFEFIPFDGVKPYDMLLEQLSDDIMVMEMDLFWIIEAGHDPFEYFEKYPGRFHMCHVKDRREDGKMVYVGNGAIDFNTIFAKASQAGLKHFFVEHDTPEDEVQMMIKSYDTAKGFIVS